MRSRLGLLFGQSFTFGLSLALLVISANALFLTDFGAEWLPWTYIVVAVLGALLSAGMTALQRRWSLPKLALRSTGSVAALLLLSWWAVTGADQRWVSFFLIVLFPLFLSIGFVFIGGQAGRLFDLRQIKRLFPRVVSGFGAGFMVGGLVGSPLITLLGSAENLLLAACASTVTMALLVALTSRRFPEALSGVVSESQRAELKLRTLFTNRFVVLIFLYQMLSAMGSQLLDFMVFSQAATHFSGSDSLARFLAYYTAALNLTDILFLALVAGWLLSRYGMRFGLAANPAGVGLFAVAMLVTAMTVGTHTLLFFGLVLVARISDIALTDGTTRTSLNTAYQALPANQRLAVQTSVEGIGIPLALGGTGVVLLLFNALGDSTLFYVLLLTLVVTLGWATSGILVYRKYAVNLLSTMRRHVLDVTDLHLEDEATLQVVQRFVNSDDAIEVHIGLNMLATAQHPSLEGHLRRLAQHPKAKIRQEALQRIEQLRLAQAMPEVESALRSAAPEPESMGAALRAYAALLEAEATPRLTPYFDDPDLRIRRSALAGLLRHGSIPGVLAAGGRLQRLATSPEVEERRLVAQVIGDVSVPDYYQPLLALLQDDDPSVRCEALVAAGQVAHPQLLPLIVEGIRSPSTRSAAMSALTTAGEAILPLVAQAFQAGSERDTLIRLLRACRQLRGEALVNTLKPHLAHPDCEVRLHLLSALQAAGYRPQGDEAVAIDDLLQREVARATRILAAQHTLEADQEQAILGRSLQDEWLLALRRLFLLLALLYDRRAILRTEQQLRQASEREQAVALEMLDVTLRRRHKNLVMALVTPQAEPGERLAQLAQYVPVPQQSPLEWLRELAADPSHFWGQPWLRVRALYYAGLTRNAALADEIAAARQAAEADVRATAEWAQAQLDGMPAIPAVPAS